jgi:hypothetical protein
MSESSLDEINSHLSINVAIDVVEVDSSTEVSSTPIWRDSIPSTPILSATRSPPTSPIISLSLVEDGLDIDTLELPLPHRHRNVESFMMLEPVNGDLRPSTPILSASCSPSSSPYPLDTLPDDRLDCDDLTLPPALHRCSSSLSIPCECDDVESDDDCRTPPLSCDDLDNSIGSLLSLHLGDDECDPGDVHYFGLKRTQGLGLDMGIGIDVVDLS